MLRMPESPSFRNATLVLAFAGWMDDVDVSPGNVRHLTQLLHAQFLDF
jgi:hypothetical protein